LQGEEAPPTCQIQSALKEVLGDHVSQAGSYVTDGVCRFDFTHFEKIKLDDLRKVERLVNEKIDASLESNIRELPIEEAKKLHATALFDEKYGDVVRVVSLGDYSTEFCGGCHVSNTNDIGMFIIDSEESISSGVRRIEARVGLGAYEFVNARRDMFESVCNDLQAKSVYEVETRLKTTEPQDSDIPKVFISGVIPTTKDDVNAELTYISKTSTFHAYITIKC
jgi:alanyl-tRNA synthetase